MSSTDPRDYSRLPGLLADVVASGALDGPQDGTSITLHLTDELAEALAQFVKRVGWAEFRANAVDDREAYEIRAAQ